MAIHTPEPPPLSVDPELQEYLMRELARIGTAAQQVEEVVLAPTNVAPTKPVEGTVVYADGVNFNPGSGEGVYVYINGAWVKLSLLSTDALTIGNPLTIKMTDNGAAFGPNLIFLREDTSPLVIGRFLFQSFDSLGTVQDYASMAVVVTDSTSGSEDARIDWNVVVAGAVTTVAVYSATGLNSTGVGQSTAAPVTATALISNTSTKLKATATNDNAAAGDYGEVQIGTAAAPGGALTTNAALNVTSISLGAGDWDVTANVGFTAAATTSITFISESISLVSATIDANPGKYAADIFPAIVIGASSTRKVMASMSTRISLAATTTVYLVALATFTVAALNAFGTISARRAR